ncbi:MAG: nitroreductase family protein [Candidatus Asgardarchaeia archaeon]
MDVFEAIKKRRSIRRYLRKKIPEDTLKRLLEAARLAPSAVNRQPYTFVVVTDDNLKEKLVPVCKYQNFVKDCSAFIAGVGDPNVSRWYVIDIAIAMEHIALEAVELGLGTCWIGAFYEDEMKKLLRIPEDKKVVVCMTVGYPAETPPERPRKPFEVLFKFNGYS